MREVTVGVDGERRKASGPALAHDQRGAVRADNGAVGKRQIFGGHPRLAVGFHDDEVGGGGQRVVSVEVESEIADVHAAVGVDYGVIAVKRSEGPKIGVFNESAIGLAAQHPPIGHRHDEEAAVGQPTESAGLMVDDGFDPTVTAGRINRDDLIGVHVAEPESVFVPARSFGKGQSGHEGSHAPTLTEAMMKG